MAAFMTGFTLVAMLNLLWYGFVYWNSNYFVYTCSNENVGELSILTILSDSNLQVGKAFHAIRAVQIEGAKLFIIANTFNSNNQSWSLKTNCKLLMSGFKAICLSPIVQIGRFLLITTISYTF